MGKQQIYDIEKKELTVLISEMTLESLCVTLNKIQIHIDLLRCLDSAEYRASDMEHITESKASSSEELAGGLQEEEVKLSFREGWSEDGKFYMGIFNRQLQGGLIGTGKGIYVPESVVRKLDLEHLDWVKAIAVYTDRSHKKDRYEYILVAKHGAYDAKSIAEISKRKIIKYGIVNFEDIIKKYYISDKDENTGLLHKITLPDSDIKRFHIEKGDIIEYAYWCDDLLNGRVVWKYQQDAVESLEKAVKTENTNSISKKPRANTVNRVLAPVFQGYTICMVGGGNRNLHKGIKEEVERRKGTFIFCTGDEPKSTLEGKLRKSDFVVVFTESLSHDSMYFTKAVCKKHQITVSYTKNLGNVQFVKRINLLIRKSNKDANSEKKF